MTATIAVFLAGYLVIMFLVIALKTAPTSD